MVLSCSKGPASSLLAGESPPRYRVKVALYFICRSFVVALLFWLALPYRRLEIEKHRVVCQRVPFRFMHWLGHRQLLDAIHFNRLPSDVNGTAGPRITILKACSIPYANSPGLTQLLRSHYDYAERWGMRYIVVSGRERSVWHKVEALRAHLSEALANNQTSQGDWVL